MITIIITIAVGSFITLLSAWHYEELNEFLGGE